MAFIWNCPINLNFHIFFDADQFSFPIQIAMIMFHCKCLQTNIKNIFPDYLGRGVKNVKFSLPDLGFLLKIISMAKKVGVPLQVALRMANGCQQQQK